MPRVELDARNCTVRLGFSCSDDFADRRCVTLGKHEISVFCTISSAWLAFESCLLELPAVLACSSKWLISLTDLSTVSPVVRAFRRASRFLREEPAAAD